MSKTAGQFPGIHHTPGVAGGDACIAHTRISVWMVVQMRRLGGSDAEILLAYPTLRAEDLANAWAYYDSHKAEIDQQIHDNETAKAARSVRVGRIGHGQGRLPAAKCKSHLALGRWLFHVLVMQQSCCTKQI